MLIGAGAPLLASAPAGAQEQQGPSRQALSAAEHYVEQLEQAVERNRGKPFEPRRYGEGAMTRVAALHKSYPDHPKVKELFERVRQALKASRGDVFEITPAMLAYKTREQELSDQIGAIARAEWQAYIERLEASGRLLGGPFPAADPAERGAAERMLMRKVVLDGFQYPLNEFTNSGEQHCFVGDAARGYYFVELSGRAWIGAYEALKRYRREVKDTLPERWTLSGTITGSNVLVPRAGEAGAGAVARFGWLVEPEAIYVDGQVLARFDRGHEHGGSFAGEDRLAAIKGPLLTVTEVPDDVDPGRLVEIFATSIKEKNWALYIDCIDPGIKGAGPRSVGRMRSHFEINIRRFHETYVHVDPYEVGTIEVVKGERLEGKDDLEGLFLDEQDRKELVERADDLIEHIGVWIRMFDDKGKQVGPPKEVILRRYKRGRWHVRDGFPL